RQALASPRAGKPLRLERGDLGAEAEEFLLVLLHPRRVEVDFRRGESRFKRAEAFLGGGDPRLELLGFEPGERRRRPGGSRLRRSDGRDTDDRTRLFALGGAGRSPRLAPIEGLRESALREMGLASLEPEYAIRHLIDKVPVV